MISATPLPVYFRFAAPGRATPLLGRLRAKACGCLPLMLLGLLVTGALTHGAEHNGNELLRGCKLSIRAAEGDAKALSGNELLAGLVCRQYVLGMIEMNTLYEVQYEEETPPSASRPFFCLPAGMTQTLQAVRIVVRYLETHPERLHLPRARLTMEALRGVFPCPTVPGPR